MKIPKFRCWDKRLQIIRDVKYIDFVNREIMFYADDLEDEDHHPTLDIVRKFEEVELMKSTDYEDDSGAEIFAKDILVDDDGNIVGVVEMDGDSWQVDGNFLSDVVANICFIRGNIYENPELLDS